MDLLGPTYPIPIDHPTSTKMPKVIYANYNVGDTFVIPKDVPLLPQSECDGDKPWCWWVKWGVLHYLDGDLKEHTLEAYCSASDSTDFKRPNDYEETEADDDEYDEGDLPKPVPTDD